MQPSQEDMIANSLELLTTAFPAPQHAHNEVRCQAAARCFSVWPLTAWPLIPRSPFKPSAVQPDKLSSIFGHRASSLTLRSFSDRAN